MNSTRKMESTVLQKKINSFLLWLLLLCTIFLLFSFSSHSSNDPLILTSKGAIQTPSLPRDISITPTLTTPSPSIPFNSSPNEALGHDHNFPSEVTDIGTMNPTSSIPADVEAQDQSSSINKACDLFTGEWVREPRGSIYTNFTCPMLPDWKNCGRYGKEQGYVYWRWKPHACEIPRFDPHVFLNIVRGKKMAFIGDSLARNHMESLMCLLSQGETPTNTYKDEKGQFQTWIFPSYNFTLKIMWSEFLVDSSERMINGMGSKAYDVHVDKINPNWARELPGLNYAVISSGAWFFKETYMYEGGKLIGCFQCKNENLTDLSFGFGFGIQRAYRTALEYISQCNGCEGLVTMLRTFSPPHFENGSWSSGGYCNRTQPLNSGSELSLTGDTWDVRKIQLEEIETMWKRKDEGNRKYVLLDVTKAMVVRADGHPGLHYNKTWVKDNIYDCVHWCTPGPVDMWSDVLLEVLKRELLP